MMNHNSFIKLLSCVQTMRLLLEAININFVENYSVH